MSEKTEWRRENGKVVSMTGAGQEKREQRRGEEARKLNEGEASEDLRRFKECRQQRKLEKAI